MELFEYYEFSMITCLWSGEDVLNSLITLFKDESVILDRINKIISALNYAPDHFEMWEGGILGIIQGTRRIIKRFV